ncbi:MAG: Uma2 family endonuclease [Hespellia sp.]|nr:Uma2 family endonuclease [Hespellia sp.]
MNLSEMEELKKEYQLDNKMISAQTGIPILVLQNIFEGDLMSQEYHTLLSLGRYFRELQEKPDHVAEAFAYHVKKRQGNYTIEDYYDWPDDRRIELIDGVIYDMAAPRYIHQRIIVEILYQIEKYIRQKNGKCEVLVAPFDVQFDKYKAAGVKEYWMIDPEEQTVTVHDFANNLFPANYSFHDQIPVRIYEGELKIDLTFIKME